MTSTTDVSGSKHSSGQVEQLADSLVVFNHCFLDAPKLVLFLEVSASLSSVSFFFRFEFLLPVAEVGVAFTEVVSRKDVETGVGAWEAGVEPGVS